MARCAGLRSTVLGIFFAVNILGSTFAAVFLNKWAVKLEGGDDLASDLARKHGFVNRGQIGSLRGYYLFEHHGVSKRSVKMSYHHIPLEEEPKVEWLEQQEVKKRVKRDLQFLDTSWPKQWYLHRGAEGGNDMNVVPVWKKGYTGRGVVVTILDDGIEYTHDDLRGNYDPEASRDINDNDDDPMPRYDTDKNENRHGTRCAGEVAASANNSKCVVGVAYNARIGGVRMLDGDDVTDFVEAQALSLNPDHIDIYSASWGPDDNGKVVDGPAALARKAFIQGVLEGRRGKGSIYVWASGNGGSSADSCNCDGYTNSIFTLSISSTSEHNTKPWYLEECSSTVAATYSSGKNYGEKQIVTTDLRNKCTESHTGTSASAPLAAAMCALALEANPELTWRDMQYIVIMSSRPDPLTDGQWRTNGLGRKFSHRYGYGLMDGDGMVQLAERWTTVPEANICFCDKHNLSIDLNNSGVTVATDTRACEGTQDVVRYLEHVQAKVSLRYSPRGDLQIHLVSPSGTRSTLLPRRKMDMKEGEFEDWPFMSVHFWGEDPRGEWALEIEDAGDPDIRHTGILFSWQLIFYGTASQPVNLKPPRTSTPRPTPTSPQSHVFQSESPTPDVFTTRVTGDRSGTKFNATMATQTFSTLSFPSGMTGLTDGFDGSGAVPSPTTSKVTTVSIPPAEVSTRVAQTTKKPKDKPTPYPCHPECVPTYGCFGPTAIECAQCQHYRLGTSGPCIPACPLNTYLDGLTYICHTCTRPCAMCRGPGEDSCLGCQEGMYLIPMTGTCVYTCPISFYPSSGVCQHCSSNCLTCSGTPGNCTSCHTGMQLLDRMCLPVCVQGEYLSTEGRCERCDSSCLSCDGPLPQDCVACGDDMFYFNGSCVAVCPPRLYPHEDGICMECYSGCLSCDGPDSDDCTGCEEGLQLHQGVCVQECPDGFYETDVEHCFPCDSTCSTCRGPSSYDCISCPVKRYLQDGECVERCSFDSYLFMGRDRFGDLMKECRRCHPSCLQCVGSGEADCTSCAGQQLLSTGRCVQHCQQGEYGSRGVCHPCHTQCLECRGPQSCSRCPAGAYLHSGQCLDQCPHGQYGTEDRYCRPCDSSCLSCKGPAADSCTSCADRYILDEGSCRVKVTEQVTENYNNYCDSHQFWDATVGTCVDCHPTCGSCRGPGPADCMACAFPRQMFKQQCVLCCYASADPRCCHCHPDTGLCVDDDIDNTLPNPVPSLPAIPTKSVPPTPYTIVTTTRSTSIWRDFFNRPEGIVTLLVLTVLMLSLIVLLIILYAYATNKWCWRKRGDYHLVPVRYQNGHSKVLLNGHSPHLTSITTTA